MSNYTFFLNTTTIILLNTPSCNILIDSIFGYLVTIFLLMKILSFDW